MKYGLLYYKDTDNIGDDIQTYASEQFLPKVDYMIDRENIESFIPNRKEYVSVIMNSWYIHDKFNFNFSPYINPLFISMFFKKFTYQDGVTVGLDYINKPVRECLMKNSPIGARDNHTKQVMEELGIPSYFSGCLTLTLKKFKNVEKKDYIITVGLNNEEIEYIRKKSNREVISIIQDIPHGSLSHMSWNERRKQVENILKKYQSAHMVITTKLHCSLPCLALKTPVLLLYEEPNAEFKDRIGTYKDYLNSIYRKDLFNTNIDYNNPPKNGTKYLALRNKIIETCEKFIKQSKTMKFDVDELVEPDWYKEFIFNQRDMRGVILKHFDYLSQSYVDECKKSSDLYDHNNELCNQVNLYKNEAENLRQELLNIYNSKSWKFLEKIRKLRKK